ncbi:MAG: hemerythrin domain-containing protein, partial [Armatimonadetes bacterium]|nr:hemerythrin domain-containing protein [Armatimonadota bacterium]
DDIAAHVEIEERLKEMDALLERLAEGEAVGAALGDTARAMADVLTRHAVKEDTEVFPMMVRVLSEEQLANVAERMAELCEIGSEREK